MSGYCSLVNAQRKANRGPRAARANRRALIAAALEVFAESGIDAPLSAVAKRAGVGQGSLYRHFPDRISLVLAAVEDNVAELEAVAADPARTLDDLLEVVTRQIIDSVAYVDIIAAAPTDPRLEALSERVRVPIATALRRAQRAGTAREAITVDEIMLAVGMVATLVAKMPAPDRRVTAEAAWALLNRATRP
ncbi:TetR/AcrR family transcriptional regulator [Myceligenerans halotolerans]